MNMLTVTEAGRYLGLPDSTIYALVRNRKLAHVRYATGGGRGTIRIERAEAERYRLSCVVPVSAEPGLPTPRTRPVRVPLAICGPDQWGDGS